MEVRAAAPTDVDALVALSAEKRAAYARVLPTFWRPARGADEAQRAFFRALLTRPNALVLVAEDGGTPVGFVIGEVRPAPPVYDPGGLTCLVDDFCVAAGRTWASVGGALLAELRRRAAARGAVQVVVVAGSHDREKAALLAAAGLAPASTWFVGPAPG